MEFIFPIFHSPVDSRCITGAIIYQYRIDDGGIFQGQKVALNMTFLVNAVAMNMTSPDEIKAHRGYAEEVWSRK